MAQAKADEIVHSIKDQLTAAGYTDDSQLDPELILHVASDVRSVVMKDYWDTKNKFTPAFYQENCCMETTCRKIECKGVWSGDSELIVEAPPIADYAGNNAVLYFGTSDKTNRQSFRYVPFQNIAYAKSDKYTGKVTMWTRIGNTIYIKNPPTQGLKYTCMIAAWDSVIIPCGNEVGDWEYPLPDFLIHKLELIVLNQLVSTFNKPEDITNDDRDSQFNGQQRIVKENGS